MKNFYKNKNVLIAGMGKSGVSSFELLNKLGAFCYIYDQNKLVLASFEGKHNCNIVYNLCDEIFKLIDFMIISPGISIYDECVKSAKLFGVKVLGEFELGTEFIKGNLIGITGTNGKTTTASLVYSVIKSAKKVGILCGNVGEPITEYILPFKTNYVAEISSFQLESSNAIHPHIAAITNITPNHLDRHLTFKNYVEAKFNIFRCMKKSDYLVLNYDDKILRKLQNQKVKPKIIYVSVNKEINGFYVKNNIVYFKKCKKIKKIADITNLQLIGKHNLQNVLIAIAICKLLKIKTKVIQKSVVEFQPLKHRLQFVKDVNGVEFVNDSKSTSPESTITAIKAFNKTPLILILGGSDKDTNFSVLAKKIKNSLNIKVVIVNGATTKKIVSCLKKCGVKNYVVEDQFENAVITAYKHSTSGSVVLLSPACASFDQFSCYKERGERFIDLVNKL